MYLIALQEMTFVEHGKISAGQVFEEKNPRDARRLIDRGQAYEAPGNRRYEARQPNYETQNVRAEVKPLTAEPFRYVPPSHEEPPALAAVRSATDAVPDIQEQGDFSARGRRGRRGSDSK